MKHLFRSLFFLIILLSTSSLTAQNSIAHRWIDMNLEAVRRDFAKPTVHARNLWHVSMGMYDAWAAYTPLAETYFLGNGFGTYSNDFAGVPEPADILAAQHQAMSYAAYRIMKHRYEFGPNFQETNLMLDTTLAGMGYSESFTSVDYENDGPAALGNYIAQEIIAAGLIDGSFENVNYSNQYYQPVNIEMPIDTVEFMGTGGITDLNRWQPIALSLFCDQAGNAFTVAPSFLSAEWGNVVPFALADSVKTIKSRDGNDWTVYHDPGPPPYIGLEGDQQTDIYRWNFDVVAKWSSFLDPSDTTTVDISPASLGNIPIESFPEEFEDYDLFYDRDNGGDTGVGYDLNPSTNQPYTPQIVKRGDYARILAEFWADGPDSETPPGHWFSIYNEVSQYPEFTWKWNGEGEALPKLEYDIKAYFALGGAMHDAAITAWSVKGYYDYIRPVSAFRAMAELGQSTDPAGPNYHPAGLELEDGHIEYISIGDTLNIADTIMIATAEHENMLKLKCWVGPLAEDTCIIGDAPDYQTEVAGVGWKFALDWWPYQRPTFVTPPFAGYVSGHSTYSRAAAEIMTLVTGDSFFPGGMGVFECPENDFLVFEEGPSETIELQWATYQDASDQCSLSRIYGGIHPPADDILGRKMGYKIGHSAFNLAETYFFGGPPTIESIVLSDTQITDADTGNSFTVTIEFNTQMDTTITPTLTLGAGTSTLVLNTESWSTDTTYVLTYDINDMQEYLTEINFSITGGRSAFGTDQEMFSDLSELYIDMLNPMATISTTTDDPLVVTMNITFDEAMDINSTPVIDFPVENPVPNEMILNPGLSEWVSYTEYVAHFDVLESAQLTDIDVTISLANDSVGNPMVNGTFDDEFSIDRKAPSTIFCEPSLEIINELNVGSSTFMISFTYDELMNINIEPTLSFTSDDPLINSLVINPVGTGWANDSVYVVMFDVLDADETLNDINIELINAEDLNGLQQEPSQFLSNFIIDTQAPSVSESNVSSAIIIAEDNGQTLNYTVTFSEAMDPLFEPTLSFPVEDASPTLSFTGGTWNDSFSYTFNYFISDADQTLFDIDVLVNNGKDLAGNNVVSATEVDILHIDMLSPTASISIDTSDSLITIITMNFSEVMDQNTEPSIIFPVENPVPDVMILNDGLSGWISDTEFVAYYDNVLGSQMTEIDLQINSATDSLGNPMDEIIQEDQFSVDLKSPSSIACTPSIDVINETTVGSETFLLIFVYDEPMDQNVEPVITFTIDDPSINSISFNAGVSGWTTPNSYTAFFDVADADETLLNIDVDVMGAQDISGFVQNPSLFTSQFILDTEAPLATVNTNDDALITDFDDGNAWTYGISFSEAMDQDAVPTISFPSDDPTATLLFQSGEWIDATTFIFNFDIFDDNAVFNNIDIQIEDAYDVNGNLLSFYNDENVVEVEMENPTVVNVNPTLSIINNPNVGTNDFSIVVEFTEPMNQDLTPVLNFTNEDPTEILSLNISSQWIDEQTYQFDFDIADITTDLTGIDVGIGGAADTVTNPLIPTIFENLFSIHVVTSIDEITLINGINIYPNPVNVGEELMISFKGSTQNTFITMTDPLGKTVLSKRIMQTAENSVRIETNGLASGTYNISVQDKNGQIGFLVIVLD